MHRYILKRILLLIPVIIGVAFVVFFIISLSPGDAAAMLAPNATSEELELIREEMGLNDPLLVQFGRYMLGLLHGDLGTSYYSNRPVFQEWIARFPATLKLAFWAAVASVVVAIPVGIISAVKQYSLADYSATLFALIGVSMPPFWLGLLLIILFSLHLGWLPSGGADSPTSVILPAITCGMTFAALLTRMTRSSMLDVIRQDYIRTARAKGVKEKQVLSKHALKNSMIPIITVVGIQFGSTLGGSTLTETVFSWPGVGRLVIDSINRKDRPMVMGCLILTTIFISIVNLLVDILYAYVDPRIKAQYSKGKK